MHAAPRNYGVIEYEAVKSLMPRSVIIWVDRVSIFVLLLHNTVRTTIVVIRDFKSFLLL